MTAVEQVITYCRICPATCGLVLDIAETDEGRRALMKDQLTPQRQERT